MYKNIFLDLDDTLIDTKTSMRKSAKELYEEFSYDKYYSDFESYFDAFFQSNTHLWEQYHNGEIDKNFLIKERLISPFRKFGLVDIPNYSEMNDFLLSRSAQNVEIIEGGLELLESLSSRYRLSLITNGFEEVQHKKIAKIGIAKYIEHVILSETAGATKPSRKIFDYALNLSDSSRSESLMIGDNWNSDIVGAKRSGIDQMWYNPDKKSPGDFEPTFTISNLYQVTDYI